MTRDRLLAHAQLVNSNFSDIKRIYYIKNVQYGAYTDTYDYNTIRITKIPSRDLYSKSTQGPKQEYSLSRAREKVFRIIEANIGRHGKFKPIFFTLTTEDQLSDLKESNKKIKQCIRRLKHHLGYSPRYIIVPERHASSAIHYHGIFFNLPFIDVKFFRYQLWGYGYIDFKVPRKIRRVSAYLAKYMTKDTKEHIPKNEKTYFCSRGLYYPQVRFDSLLPNGTLIEARLTYNGRMLKYKNHE